MNTKVLLVEDSKVLREALMDMLSDCPNLSVEDFATTQEDAISILNSKPFDLIIADIELARGNGFEVISHTQQESYPYRPPEVIMLTNHANAYYRKVAKKLGIKHFYDKSMDFETAISTIETVASRLN